MTFISAHLIPKQTCPQCQREDNVMAMVDDNAPEKEQIRLIACIICILTAVDTAMDWNFTKSAISALAMRHATTARREEIIRLSQAPEQMPQKKARAR